jgi:hypothetical protein
VADDPFSHADWARRMRPAKIGKGNQRPVFRIAAARREFAQNDVEGWTAALLAAWHFTAHVCR